MMQRQLPVMKRTPQSSSGDDHFSCSSTRDDYEKTIPFLRQLTDMLQNNDELISFVPGLRSPIETVHGKIIVHDRNRVQSEVLPVYFNHASFASLRRQLSYFSFVRVGKSRQSGVTYINPAVVELSDILRLKRRPSTSGVQGQMTDPHAVAAVWSQSQKLATEDQQVPHPRQLHGHLANISADVASAVLSGTLHAAKANHILDINNGGGTITIAKSDSVGRRLSTVNSYADSSMSHSSDNDASKDTASNKDCGVNDHDENNGHDEKTMEKKRKAFSKRRHHQRTASSSMVKHHIPRKDRARLQRMLSVNVIVPFIHLPAGHASRRKKKSMAVIHDPIIRGDGGECSGRDDSAAKENMARMIDRATSDAAINALLALGSDCQ
ncbi:hypothetical protein ACHAXA_010413 [Cyclostephanos tholiformis]|uniref:HSF-type DNA-binding domain-containing protein n=1 Tax=Cyclostephanos tholiformis TaxID=382380 RepID=A0ABD3SF37_9STRA